MFYSHRMVYHCNWLPPVTENIWKGFCLLRVCMWMQLQRVPISGLSVHPLLVSSFYFVILILSLLRLRVARARRTDRVCARLHFGAGRSAGDAKVGSLPHGCVYCRETSVYPPAQTALGALERRCARPKPRSDSHLQDAGFVSHLPSFSVVGGRKKITVCR